MDLELEIEEEAPASVTRKWDIATEPSSITLEGEGQPVPLDAFRWPDRGDNTDNVTVYDESAKWPDNAEELLPLEVFTLGDKQDWTPQTEEDFEWVLRKLHGYKAEERQYSARGKARVEEAKASYAYYLNKYGLPFQEWAKAQIEAKAKKPLEQMERGKSLQMGLGMPGFKKAGGEIEIDVNHRAFMLWMRGVQDSSYQLSCLDDYQNGQSMVNFWKFKAEVDTQAIVQERLEHVAGVIEPGEGEKHVIVDKETGEVVEWATWIPERQEFYVKF